MHYLKKLKLFLLENFEWFDVLEPVKWNTFENIEWEYYLQHERTSKKRRTTIIILWWGAQRECRVIKFCHHLAPFTNLYMSNVIKLQHCAVAVHVPHITRISDLFSKAVVLQRFLLACSVKYMKFINFHIYTHKVALWLNYKD